MLKTPYTYHLLSPITFNEGYAVVEQNDTYCYIDHKGEQAFDSTFVDAHNFRNGLAAVGVEGHYGITQYRFINTKGEFIIEPTYYDAQYFTEGLIPVQDLFGKWGFANQQGELVIPCNMRMQSHLRKDWQQSKAEINGGSSTNKAIG